MRYSNYEQSRMDAECGLREDAYRRKERLKQPCKNEQEFCRPDGGCLRCNADAGEACREITGE
jgi:hypothetical protein